MAELFKNPDFGAHTQPPILYKDHFYVQYTVNERSDGLVCMTMSGQVKWKTGDEPTFSKGGAVLADGLLLAADGNTKLYLIEPDPEAFKPLASAVLLESANNWAPIALVDGRLLIRASPARKVCSSSRWLTGPLLPGLADVGWRGATQHGLRHGNLPESWDVKSGKNIKWKAQIGSTSYGNPVVADGKIFLGTNNGNPRNPDIQGDKGVLMCFRESDGKFLWQAVTDKLASGPQNDFPEQGVCSSPAVDGKRLYYVSNRGELVCLDTEGFLDGKNDGPFQGEVYKGPSDADIVWKLDMMKELGVYQRNMANSSPVIWEDLVFVETSNGRSDEKVPSPKAPSFLAVNKNTGKVVWQDNSPGDGILQGQWSSPALGLVDGVQQAFFAGGDGWLYGFNARTGEKLWKFDLNPKNAFAQEA